MTDQLDILGGSNARSKTAFQLPVSKTVLNGNHFKNKISTQDCSGGLFPPTIDRNEDSDPVGRYLKKIGCFRLLTPADEIEIAKQIEFHEQELMRSILQSPATVSYIVNLGSRIKKRKASARDLLMCIHRRGAPVSLQDKIDLFLESVRQIIKLLAIETTGYEKLPGKEMAPRDKQGLAEKLGQQGGRLFNLMKIWRFETSVIDEIVKGIYELENSSVAEGRLSPATLSRIQDSRTSTNALQSQFVTANLRLVVNIAKRYRWCGMPFIDLIQEGNLGLLKAAARFEYRRGTRFSTCAVWWIRQAILRAIDNTARTIRLPIHISEKYHRLRSVRQRFYSGKKRNRHVEEFADLTGITDAEAERILEIAGEPFSLDTPLTSETTCLLGDTLADGNLLDPFNSVVHRNLTDKLRKVLAILTPREEKVLRMRFGIGEKRDHTLHEISRKFDLTAERIRQIEARALQKLQHSKYSCNLRTFIDR